MVSGNKEVQISVIIPVYNEGKENIDELYSRISATLSSRGWSYELVFIDDGSKKVTFEMLRALHQRDGKVKLVRLKRNSGQAAALLAGCDYARGKIIVTIDSDLQYFPEDIPKFVQKVNEGFDAVSGKRMSRCAPLFTRRIPSCLINIFLSKKAGLKIDYGCSFNAIRKEVIWKLKGYGKRSRFIKPLLAKLAKSLAEVEVRQYPRKKGRSQYNLFPLVAMGFDILINFSLVPSLKNGPLYSIEQIME